MQDATNHLSEDAGVLPTVPPPSILVVDDDAGMRMILSLTLGTFGYTTLVAANGKEALQLARDHPEIRVILLDVVMPGFSGKELADQLQTNLPKAVILFCSGHASQMLSCYGLDRNTIQFLQKPCRPPELQRKIEELLATR
jgi:CheY-like chemotaxis protein